MADDTSNGTGLSIQADDKNGVLSGSGSLNVKVADKGSVMAAFQAVGDGKTQVTIKFGDTVSLSPDDSLAFEGHAGLHPGNGQWSGGTSVQFTTQSGIAVDLKAQLDAGGPSGSLNLKIPL